MNQHTPRRSGVGIRQAIPAAKPKAKRRKFRPATPETCGALNPERPGIVDDETGEWLVEPMFCAGSVEYDVDANLKPVRRIHLGDHRARPLRGVLVRWSA